MICRGMQPCQAVNFERKGYIAKLIQEKLMVIPSFPLKQSRYLEVELGAGVGLEQDLAVYLAKPWLHCTLGCQPACIPTPGTRHAYDTDM